jgi:hypothetical protein
LLMCLLLLLLLLLSSWSKPKKDPKFKSDKVPVEVVALCDIDQSEEEALKVTKGNGKNEEGKGMGDF